MATSRKIDDPGFLTKFPWPTDIKGAAVPGFAEFEDGDLKYVVMLDSVQMSVIHRTKTELFEKTIEDAVTSSGLGMTGCFMDNTTLRAVLIKGGTEAGKTAPAPPDLQDFAGKVVESPGGTTVTKGISEPNKAFLGFKRLPTPQIEIDIGDPGSFIVEGFGGLGPAIIKRNKGGTGLSNSLSNKWYNALVAEGAKTGWPFVAISQSAKIILAGVKEHNKTATPDLNGIRDALFNAGFDDAVVLDGGDSALMHLKGRVPDPWILRPGPFKKRITTFGLKFFYTSSP